MSLLLIRVLITVSDDDGRTRQCRSGGSLFIRGETLAMDIASGTAMPGVTVIESVLDVFNESTLIVDSEDGVGRNIDPVFCCFVNGRPFARQ